jgi:polyisoprenoid-binding protein YceI
LKNIRFGLGLFILAVVGTLAAGAALLLTPPAPAQAQTGATRLTIVDGTEGRFRAREILLGRIITNEAVGSTREVSGSLLLLPDNSFAPESGITLELGSLQSDQEIRDFYIKTYTLDVGTYPNVRFVPTAVSGLPQPLPPSGQVSFQMMGNLTVRGQARPVTWDIVAELSETAVTGSAVANVRFDALGLVKPEVEDVLSIEDDFKLELDFKASREAA